MRIFLVPVLLGLLFQAGGVRAETLYFLHVDHLGTPRLAVGEDGVERWRWDNLEPFGDNPPIEVMGPEGYLVNIPLRLPGQYFDKETGLTYNMARDYDPAIGRYIQTDSIKLSGTINLYAYVDSDPLRYADPLGRSKVTGQGSIGGNDPIVSGISRQSTPQQIQNAIHQAQKVLRDPNASSGRKRFLRGWIKVAKRGFTRSICPPFLEDLVQVLARHSCLNGDLASCRLLLDMDPDIPRPDDL